MGLFMLVLLLGVVHCKAVLETQHTTCTISTEQLVATARASVTRVVKGLCNVKDMEALFRSMEAKVTEEMNLIKIMILNLGERLFEMQRSRPQLSKRRSVEPVDDGSELHSWNSREEELRMYNSTIHSKKEGSARRTIFTYYWRPKGLAPQRSSSFYISPSGYRMYLRMQLRSNEDTIIFYVGITKGDFDNDLPWPFKLHHQLSVLDQRNGRERDDINSVVWNPSRLVCSPYRWERPTSDGGECSWISVALNTIRSGYYLVDGNLLIRLTVYLDGESLT